MRKLTINENTFELNFKGKKYHIVDRLIAYYLSRYALSKEKYDSIKEADKLLWAHYHYYMNNPELCESEARQHSRYVVSNYIKYS